MMRRSSLSLAQQELAEHYILSPRENKISLERPSGWCNEFESNTGSTKGALADQLPPSPEEIGSNPFENLPIEIRQRIATFIEYDKDLCSFRGICQSTHDAVDADNCSFWRRRFLIHFDKLTMEASNQEYRRAYQKRRHILKNGAAFRGGKTERERMCIQELMEMILDTYSGDEGRSLPFESKNITAIKKFVVDSNMVPLFRWIYEQPPTQGSRRSTRNTRKTRDVPNMNLMCAFQVMCAPLLLSFEHGLSREVLAFGPSQYYAYRSLGPTSFDKELGTTIDMWDLLYQVNFWRYHMCREAEHTLYPSFEALDEHERPQFWKSPLKYGVSALGKHWKGSYAYIAPDEIKMVGLGDEADLVLDNFSGDGGAHEFQELFFEMVDDEEKIVWPAAFEEYFADVEYPQSHARTRMQSGQTRGDEIQEARHFHLSGTDCNETVLARGWIKALPPQHGLPGWQQMDMIKYSLTNQGSIDMANFWVYNGVVFPGGQMIMGRWVSPWTIRNYKPYSGPFIMWCVDGATQDA